MDGIETKNVFIKLAARFDDPEKIKSLRQANAGLCNSVHAGIIPGLVTTQLMTF